jgi:hypothetical protein
VLIIVVVAYFGFKTVGNAGNLDQGQVKYTPGVPPWMEKDPNKRGPSGGTTAPPYAQQTTQSPPGMSVPNLAGR